jgi:hypothetical protein
MSAEKHTAEHWELRSNGIIMHCEPGRDYGEVIAAVRSRRKTVGPMLAAAPDMLTALREAYDFLSANYQNLSTGNWHDDDAGLVAGNILATIAKAEGRQP